MVKRTNKKEEDFYSKYRTILGMPDLTDVEVMEIQKNIQLIVQAICEHTWDKKFY